jgi:hypothetical protein
MVGRFGGVSTDSSRDQPLTGFTALIRSNTALFVFLPCLSVATLLGKLFEIPGQASTWYRPAGVVLALFVSTVRRLRMKAAVVALVARILNGYVFYPEFDHVFIEDLVSGLGSTARTR